MIIPAAENMRLSQEEGGIRIPIEYNSNDKGSLFAGSIFSGAVIAGYRLAEKTFEGIEGALVAKESRIRYLKAIYSDGFAVATAASEPVVKPNGNRTFAVTVVVKDTDENICAEVDTEYVKLVPR